MSWKNDSHHGYGVLSETINTFQGRAVYSSEFSVPPGTDFTVICNYGASNTSVSTHVEMFYSDVPGGTFRQRGLTVGGFNATTAAIDTATKVLINDVSTVREYPVYKLKVPSGGGASAAAKLVKFVVMYGKVPSV